MYKIALRFALFVWVLGAVVFLFLFALQFARGSFDCPPGTYPVNTVWVDAETGEERVDSICVQQR